MSEVRAHRQEFVLEQITCETCFRSRLIFRDLRTTISRWNGDHKQSDLTE